MPGSEARLCLAGELLGRGRAHERGLAFTAHDGLDIRLVGPQLGARRGDERGRCRFDVPKLEGTVFGAPLGKPAVQHRHLVVAEGAEQPPQPRSPLPDRGVIDDDACACPDAQGAGRLGETFGIRAGEGIGALGVREGLDQVGEHGTGHVPLKQILLVTAQVSDGAVGPGEARDRGVDDQQPRGAEVIGEPLGRDKLTRQSGCVAHAATLTRKAERCHGPRNSG